MAYEICIYVSDDNTFSVTKESIEGDEEGMEGKGSGDIKSFRDALNKAEMLYNEADGGDFDSAFNEFAK